MQILMSGPVEKGAEAVERMSYSYSTFVVNPLGGEFYALGDSEFGVTAIVIGRNGWYNCRNSMRELGEIF